MLHNSHYHIFHNMQFFAKIRTVLSPLQKKKKKPTHKNKNKKADPPIKTLFCKQHFLRLFYQRMIGLFKVFSIEVRKRASGQAQCHYMGEMKHFLWKSSNFSWYDFLSQAFPSFCDYRTVVRCVIPNLGSWKGVLKVSTLLMTYPKA